MFTFSAIGSVLKTIASPVTTYLKNKGAIKQAKVDSELAVIQATTKATIDAAAKGQQAQIDWNTLSIKNSGWKDEWFVLLFSIPLIMCFIPGLDVYVDKGFTSLSGTPEWYQWSLGIMVSSAFGYQKFANSIGERFKRKTIAKVVAQAPGTEKEARDAS